MPTPDAAPDTRLLWLLRLVSPALPIGSFNFSQGLEWAVEAGWVRDEETLLDWCSGLVRHSLGTLDLPMLLRLRQALDAGDDREAVALSARLLASRETAELRAEERHLARALAKVLVAVEVPGAADWLDRPEATHAALFALAASHGHVPPHDMAQGWLWAWCENQVIAALKLLPLGQSAGQRVQQALMGLVPGVVARAAALDEDNIGTAAPRAAMGSAWHEQQYSRLFRS